jgi:hypothetical protein
MMDGGSSRVGERRDRPHSRRGRLRVSKRVWVEWAVGQVEADANALRTRTCTSFRYRRRGASRSTLRTSPSTRRGA